MRYLAICTGYHEIPDGTVVIVVDDHSGDESFSPMDTDGRLYPVEYEKDGQYKFGYVPGMKIRLMPMPSG